MQALRMFALHQIPMIRSTLLFFLLLLAGSPESEAQIIKPRGRSAAPPKALIVMLLTRGGQRDHLVRLHPELLPEFDRDVREVNRRIVIDFSENFRYCPVYFVIDTNVNRFAAGEWSEVLFDSSLQPAKAPVIRPGSRDYFIAHYGGPTPQPDSVRTPTQGDLGGESETYGEDPTGLLREKLLVADPDFHILTSDKGPKTTYARALRPTWMSVAEYQRYRREMTYNAKRWFVDYIPSAYPYDVTLRKYFRKRQNQR